MFQENITMILDSNENKLSITLRFEPGQSLDKHSDSQKQSTLSQTDCQVIWKQMSSALAYLHSNSVTHDDVKPENIMWHGEGQRSVLIDFGAALDYTVQPAELFNPSGTPPYVPPEFLQRRKCSAGDVWALGIVMVYVLGHIGLPDGNWLLPGVFEDDAVLQEMLVWLAMIEELRKSVISTDLVLSRMLEADPESRITSSELLRRLEA
jgi:serine/threonine protein kinase